MPHATPHVPLLTVTNLTVEFVVEHMGAWRRVRAVDQVSFTIDRGETLGLLGESGCGKSVTALSIVGLLPPAGQITGGSLLFDGHELTTQRGRARRAIRGSRIGYICQEPMTALNPVFTVGDQIAEALIVQRKASRADARRRAIAWLDAVRIPNAAARARDYPHQLSGGQRQRVLIAAALACEPVLLIADEPTTALDVTVQAEMLDLLDTLRREFNLALILITHDLGVAAQCADRAAVMYAGRIVEEGPARAVLTSPFHPYTRGLLRSLPGATPGQLLQAIPGVVPDPAALPPGCAFAPRCPDWVNACDARKPDATVPMQGRSVRCIRADGAS